MSRPFDLEFGAEVLHLSVPDHAEILSLPESTPLPNPAGAIRAALNAPVKGPPLSELARRAVKRRGEATAVIVVSDNTRPVPYRGEQSLLLPLLEALWREGLRQITILVATGTHRMLSDEEMHRLLPPEAFDPTIRIINHDCRNAGMLRFIGNTARGTEVWINRLYLDADLKILTGLVEPHFMAGFSGGPKSICPGLVGEKVTYLFHGPAMMADPRACSLNVKSNPCQEESAAVAAMAGADFILNATINRRKELTGIFTGELRAAHRAAIARVRSEASLPLKQEYDVVLTHAGFSGINHYQAAKAAVEASRAIKTGGVMILAGNHTDINPIGGPQYRQVLPLLRHLGADAFDRLVSSADWTFVPEQWEVQYWGRVLRKLGPAGRLIYCSPQLSGSLFSAHELPGEDGGAEMTEIEGRAGAEAMVQKAIDRFAPQKSFAILADGPYGVPIIHQGKR